MTIGPENLTTNETVNTTIEDIQGGLGETIGEQIAGGYQIVGFLFLGMFIYALYRSNVSMDTGIIFMIPTLFIFGNYGMLPGGSGTWFGLVLSVAGLFAFGLYRYFA